MVIFECTDDRSRYLVSLTAWPAETTAGAWAAVSAAIRDYGKPRLLLSDNSLAFTGRLYGIRVLLEKNLHDIGRENHSLHPRIIPKPAARMNAVIKPGDAGWRPGLAANDLVELQQLLDQYRVEFNNRPHQALGGRTPLEQRAASTGSLRIQTPSHPNCPPLSPPQLQAVGAQLGSAVSWSDSGWSMPAEQMIAFTTGEEVGNLLPPISDPRLHHRPQPQLSAADPASRRPTTPTPSRTARVPARRLPAVGSTTTASPAGRAAAVKMEPPTGGTILTGASPGIPCTMEEPSTRLPAMSCP